MEIIAGGGGGRDGGHGGVTMRRAKCSLIQTARGRTKQNRPGDSDCRPITEGTIRLQTYSATEDHTRASVEVDKSWCHLERKKKKTNLRMREKLLILPMLT